MNSPEAAMFPERMPINSIRHRAHELAAMAGEATVRTYTGDLITGNVTFAGERKFRVDTPLAAIFFEYSEVERVD